MSFAIKSVSPLDPSLLVRGFPVWARPLLSDDLAEEGFVGEAGQI